MDSSSTSSTFERLASSRLARDLFGFDRPETQGERLHVRLVEGTIAAFAAYLCWTWGLYIQRNISEPHLELGVAQYIDVSFMFDHYVAVGNAVVIAILLLLGLLRAWRPAYFVAVVLFHLQYVTKNILGEISHGSNLVGMGVLGLGLAHLYFSDETNRRRFAVGFLYFFIGVGYTSAAVCKLVATGVTWAHGHHLWMWIAERKTDVISKFGAFDPNLLQEIVLTDVTWATAVLTFGHLSELFSFLIWWRPFRYPVMLMVVALHIGIWLTMNIFFTWTTILLALLALPWGTVYDRVRAPDRLVVRSGREARAHS
mgnify:CR=1 FL=1